MAPLVQQRRLQDGARRHHPHDAALDDSFGQGRVAELFADGYLVSLANQAGQVGFQRNGGHAGHGDAGIPAHGAGGQRDFQGLGKLVGVVVKALVKVAHPEQQDGVRVGVLDGEVLATHRGEARAGR